MTRQVAGTGKRLLHGAVMMSGTKWSRPLPGRDTYWERPFTRLPGMLGSRRSRLCGSWAGVALLDKGAGKTWHAILSLKPPEFPTAACDAPVEREKRPRDDSDPWRVGWCPDVRRRPEILAIPGLVISWVNGTWKVKGRGRAEVVRGVVDQLMSHFEKFVAGGNEKADELAKAGAIWDE